MYQALDVLTQGCLDFLVADVTHAYFLKSNVSVKVTFVAQMLEGKISVWSLALAVSLQGKTKDLRHGQNFPNHHKDTEAALHFSKKGKRELPARSRVERAYIKAFVENEEFKENSNIQIYPCMDRGRGGEVRYTLDRSASFHPHDICLCRPQRQPDLTISLTPLVFGL